MRTSRKISNVWKIYIILQHPTFANAVVGGLVKKFKSTSLHAFSIALRFIPYTSTIYGVRKFHMFWCCFLHFNVNSVRMRMFLHTIWIKSVFVLCTEKRGEQHFINSWHDIIASVCTIVYSIHTAHGDKLFYKNRATACLKMKSNPTFVLFSAQNFVKNTVELKSIGLSGSILIGKWTAFSSLKNLPLCIYCAAWGASSNFGLNYVFVARTTHTITYKYVCILCIYK